MIKTEQLTRTAALGLMLAGCLLALPFIACTAGGSAGTVDATAQGGSGSAKYTRPAPDTLKEKLTPLQWHVTQESGTEPAFSNEFWDNHEAGLYVDVVSGEPLFASTDKFDSGTGWPSFTRPVEEGALMKRTDTSAGMVRGEVRSRGADSHLGHVFDDGPADRGGLRYCINSAALRFIPAARLEAEGYGEWKRLFVDGAAGKGSEADMGTSEVAILAGGCFWGMEQIIRDIPGVISTEVGYAGGSVPNPNYEIVKTGRSGHAEAIKVTFDQRRLSYEDLLGWFFRMHDPTTLNQQGNDVGTQYRSAIFVADEAQRKTAEAVKAKVGASGKWKNPIVTEIVQAATFTPAEEYHQDYLVKHPGGYTCHYVRN